MYSESYKYILENHKYVIDDITKNLKNGIHILHGSTGTGKTSFIETLVKDLDLDALEFNASSKYSIKFIKTSVEDFIKNVIIFQKPKCIVFDEFENIISENIGAQTILTFLRQYKVPIFIIVNNLFLQRLKKSCTRNTFFYIKMITPTQQEIFKYLHKNTSRNINKTKDFRCATGSYERARSK